MSIEALNWVIKQEWESPSQFAVLMLLANYADEDASCYPSQQHIGKVTRLSERTVRDVVVRVEAMGRLVREKGETGAGKRHRLTRYRLLLENDSRPSRRPDVPANSAGTNSEAADPAAAAGPPGDDAGNGGGLNRQMPPDVPATIAANTKGESERESVSPERERARDPALDELVRKHPTGAQADQWEIDDAWAALTGPEQREAVARFDDWLAGKKGKHVLGLAKYLAQRSWQYLPPATPSAAAAGVAGNGAADRLEAFSRAWWFVWHEARRLRSIDRGFFVAGKMGKLAMDMGIGWTPREPIDEAAAEQFVRVPVGSPEFDAWRRHFETEPDQPRNGGWVRAMPRPSKAEWIFAPTRWPPGPEDDEPVDNAAPQEEAQP